MPSDAFRSTTRGAGGCCDWCGSCVLAAAALFVPCAKAVPVKITAANSKKSPACFTGVTLLNLVATKRHGFSSIRCVLSGAELFMSESDHRIDADRPPRRHIGSKHGDTDEQKGNTRKRQWICRPHAIKQTRH